MGQVTKECLSEATLFICAVRDHMLALNAQQQVCREHGGSLTDALRLLWMGSVFLVTGWQLF